MTQTFIEKQQEEALKLYWHTQRVPSAYIPELVSQVIKNTCEEVRKRLPDEMRTMTDGKVYMGVVGLDEIQTIISEIEK